MNRWDGTDDQHPGKFILHDFASGMIEDELIMTAVEEHVADCHVCCSYLAELSPGETEATVANWAEGSNIAIKTGSARYEVIEEIGRGGSGVVYKARQAGLDRLLAWKVLISGARASPAELARFRREAHTLALLDHPQIVKVYDFGEQEGAPFLAMELVDGLSLARRLERGPVEPRLVATWIRGLAHALDYAHQRSIFHRDLKPQNVLLARNGEGTEDHQFVPKIVDFGLAKFESDSLFKTRTGETLGTPAYLAPEMIGTKHGEEGNAAVDVYGLGTVFYQGLTGRPPFIGSSHLEILTAVAQSDPPSIQVLRHLVPRDLAVICHRCLAKNPAQRFSSAAELADDLDRFLNGKPIASRAVSRTERAIRWCRRNPWKALAGSLLGLAIMAVPAAGIYHNAQLRDQKQTAQARYESTRETLWKMLNLLNTDQTASIPQLADLSAKQTEQALALFDELATVDPTERSRLDLAKAEILAGTIAIVLGKTSEAESHLGHAVGICRELHSDPLVADEAMEQQAAALNKLAVSLPPSTDHSQGIEYMEQALKIHRKLAEKAPDNPTRRGGVAWSLMNLGAALQVQGHPDRAVTVYEEAVRIWDALALESINVADSRQAAAGTRINLASIELGRGNLEIADGNFRLALETLEQLLANSPDSKSVVEDLSSGLLNHSNCLQGIGRTDEAVAACTRARELLLNALKQEPNRALLRQNLFLVTANRASLLGGQDGHVKAAVEWKEAVELATGSDMKTYCQQMRLCSLARSGDIEIAQTEIELIDESALAPNEKFLQAVCWALLAKAHSRQPDSGLNDQKAAVIEANVSRAWDLLGKLDSDGLMSDDDRRDHLKTSDDWSELRRIHSPEELEELVR